MGTQPQDKGLVKAIINLVRVPVVFGPIVASLIAAFATIIGALIGIFPKIEAGKDINQTPFPQPTNIDDIYSLVRSFQENKSYFESIYVHKSFNFSYQMLHEELKRNSLIQCKNILTTNPCIFIGFHFSKPKSQFNLIFKNDEGKILQTFIVRKIKDTEKDKSSINLNVFCQVESASNLDHKSHVQIILQNCTMSRGNTSK